MHPEYDALRRLGRFSLGDPGAGRKLIENLDRRRVRLQVVEMCWHFGIPFPSDVQRARVKAFLDDLVRHDLLRQPALGLYCRPDMIGAQSGASLEDAAAKLVALVTQGKRVLATRPAIRKTERPAKRVRPMKPKAPRILAAVPLETEPPSEVPIPSIEEAAAPEPTAPSHATNKIASNLLQQTRWILGWLHAQGAPTPKSKMAAAAVAAAVVPTVQDVDVPLQHLYNRMRVYLSGHDLLKLTQFGEREAEALAARAKPPEPSETRTDDAT